MRRSYASDLSDSEWAYLRSRLSELPKTIRTRTHSVREIFDAIFYVLKTGCHWRLLPHDFPPWQTVFYHYRRFRFSGMWHRIFAILRGAQRKRAGKDLDASAAIMDSQSITDHRGVRQTGRGRLRRSQEREGQEATPVGGHSGSATLGLCRLRQRSG